MTDIDDIKNLPYLDKQAIRDPFEELIPLNFQKRLLFKKVTSGTTGSPLTILADRKLIQSEHAFVARGHWITARITLCMKRSQNRPAPSGILPVPMPHGKGAPTNRPTAWFDGICQRAHTS
jgi:hypothetical protein